ncbi:MAG: hypothetical protein ABI723_08295 [Bacteroidia bacterium]
MKEYPINIRFDQVLQLVKMLPDNKKRILSKELEKDFVNKKLTELLNAFKTNEISEEEINTTVEEVRTRIYASKANKNSH